MTEGTKERIAFDVETSRVLEILSSEIYDSPKAFLRENVQNAYDAVLMRCTAQSLRLIDSQNRDNCPPKAVDCPRRRHWHDR